MSIVRDKNQIIVETLADRQGRQDCLTNLLNNKWTEQEWRKSGQTERERERDREKKKGSKRDRLKRISYIFIPSSFPNPYLQAPPSLPSSFLPHFCPFLPQPSLFPPHLILPLPLSSLPSPPPWLPGRRAGRAWDPSWRWSCPCCWPRVESTGCNC